jgi:hypothetical protein
MQPQNPDNDPYGQQPPPYGNQPPSGDQPPPYGSQPPPYGQQPSYPSGDYTPPPTSGQPYGAGGGYGAPAAQNNTLGLIALIVGILSIVPLAVCCPLLGVPAGIAAVVLGIQGQKKADQGQATNRGQAKAGFITGIVGVVLSVLNFIASLALDFNAPGPGF